MNILSIDQSIVQHLKKTTKQPRTHGECQEPRELISSCRPNSGGIKDNYSQIQWPVPSINAELVEVFLEGE